MEDERSESSLGGEVTEGERNLPVTPPIAWEIAESPSNKDPSKNDRCKKRMYRCKKRMYGH